MCFLLYSSVKEYRSIWGEKNELKFWVFYLAPVQNKWSTWRAVTLGCWEYLSGLEYWMVFVHLLEEIMQSHYFGYVGYICMFCVYIHCWLFQEHIKKWEKQNLTLSYFPLNVSKLSQHFLGYKLVVIHFWSSHMFQFCLKLIVKLLNTETQSNISMVEGEKFLYWPDIHVYCTTEGKISVSWIMRKKRVNEL